MCEVLERKDRRQDIPCESDADKTDDEIVEGLMEMTAFRSQISWQMRPHMNEDLKKAT